MNSPTASSPENELIEASAGTGKTQALANRLIDLLRHDVKPQEIVALTFSRAAAGEIFERFVSLLAERAEAELAGGGGKSAQLLREVIATQHLSQIGTLDSFLMRVVRAFPLELGLAGELEMMDDYAAGAERNRVSFSILRRTDEKLKKNFVEAFALAMNGEDVRSFVESYRKFISSWHERIAADPEPSAWGDAAAIWGRTPAFATVTERELGAAADALAAIDGSKPWQDFADWVRGFRGSFAGVKGIAKKLVEADGVFDGASVEFAFNRRAYAFTGEAAAVIRTALTCVCGYVVRMKLGLARGIFTLLSVFEKAYDEKVRRAGRLVFADVPRLITRLGEAERLALEYRLDARIRAWALDEFQDTSREQWRALGNLIDEAKQSDGEKSVFVVGDRKQAIYGWRNGDVSIFECERDSGTYAVGELARSYRYGRALTEAINRVFTTGSLTEDFPAWKCPVHETAKTDVTGFVQAVEASGGKMEDFVEPLFNALRAVDPVKRGISAAVLVRSNRFGEMLADRLRARGLGGVVWEGESAVLDTPALSGFLDLVQLADHPGDMLTYRHFGMTPVAKAKYPDGVPDAGTVSREMALSFTTRGLVRTFRELRALLPEDPAKAWSVFTEERFTDMLRAASEFELAREPGTRLADFADFLASKKKRNLAEAGRIKIMTIHRSKGLGFDYVALPLYEHEGLDAEPDGPLVGDGWILPDPGAKVAKCVGGLEAAYRLRKDRAEQEALCTYYVAMTRAKYAMTVIMHPARESSTSVRFSNYVRRAIAEPIGDPAWYEDFEKPAAGPSDVSPAAAVMTAPERGKRGRVRRRLPSLGFASGQSAGDLFTAGGARRAALARGTEVHAEYERVEFLDAAAAKNDLERELVRPEGFVALWRERAFETFVRGEWVSGRFDRVVFTDVGGVRRAVVYDYKTNRPLRGETPEAFAERMRAAYAAQLGAYRAAVSALTGLPPEAVACRLLLVETGASVEISET